MADKVIYYLQAIGHRGATSLAVVLLTISAARMLETSEFAVISVLLTINSLALVVSNSFLCEPYTVFAAQRDHAGQMEYAVRVINTAVIYGFFCALLYFAAAGIQNDSVVAIFAAVCPFVILVDAFDRIFFLRSKTEIPFLISLAILAISVSLLAYCFYFGVNDSIGLLSIYLCAVLIGLLTYIFYFFNQPDVVFRPKVLSGKSIKAHIDFARYSLIAHMILFGVSNGYLLVLGVTGSAHDVAQFRAQLTIMGVMAQIFSALGMLALAQLSALPPTKFMERLNRLLKLIVLAGGAFAVLYSLAGDTITRTIFGTNFRLDSLSQVVAALIPLSMGACFLMGSGLRALNRARSMSELSLRIGVVAIPAGVLLCSFYGTQGALVANLLGTSALACCFYLAIKRDVERQYVNQIR